MRPRSMASVRAVPFRADQGLVAAKRLKLRRPDRCVRCTAELPAGVIAQWDSSTRTVTCVVCAEGSAATATEVTDLPRVDGGVPGASLGREHTRRRARREQRVRDAHPRLGGLLLALNGAPQHEEAFRIGEAGEIAVGAAIENAVAKVDGIVLHNRRLPGRRGDIDHIAIVPSGIYVIDAKAVRGKVEVRRPWRTPPQLFIAGRDRTNYLDGLDRQIEAVRAAIHAAGLPPALAWGALCFTDADLPRLRAHEVRGHLLIYRRALTKRLTTPGAVERRTAGELAAAIDSALPPA
jgi:hypothetical protein